MYTNNNFHHPTDSDSCSEDDMRHGVPHSSSNLMNPSRKRRRGIIEKRRRDRINTSLSELKRLVPQALEKSGSAKLEKAEILQMTVDHLKTLATSNNFADNTRLARDYHGVGFRECAAEVSRYLVSVEGMDIQDPLRIRLMSHLQMFIAQRSSQGQVPQQVHQPPQTHYTPPTAWTHCYNPHAPPPASYPGYDKAGDPMFDPFYAPPMPPRPPSTANPSTATTNYTMTMTATAGVAAPSVPIGFTASVQANPLYHVPSSESSIATSTTSSSTPNYANLTSSKPYRPWGAEMAC